MKRCLMVCIFILCLTLPVGAVSPDEKEQQPVGYVALTFDDGPSGALTEELLDGLKAKGARATFFLCGYRMKQYPSALERYAAEGHEVGVHSTVHTDLTKLSREAVHQDMKNTAQQIFIATGIRPTIMRPPGGAYDEVVKKEAGDEGMSVVLWSVDPKDWAHHNAQAVLQTMAKRTGDGDIILMHDMSHSSVEAALRLVDEMQARGYVFVTVSELAALGGKTMTPGEVYSSFCPEQ